LPVDICTDPDPASTDSPELNTSDPLSSMLVPDCNVSAPLDETPAVLDVAMCIAPVELVALVPDRMSTAPPLPSIDPPAVT
jgi:hypothetical protein